MRLKKVENGHPIGRKLAFRMMKWMMGAEPYDIVKLVTYRPEFLGSHINALTQEVMRGPSEWSVGDRELFAAFVSKLNKCSF